MKGENYGPHLVITVSACIEEDPLFPVFLRVENVVTEFFETYRY